MSRNATTVLVALTLAIFASFAHAESWQCGGAKIHCGGSEQSCNRLKKACTEAVLEHSDVDRELAQAVQDANDGKLSSSGSDPFERLSRSMSFTTCTEQEAQSGRCGVLYNAKELVSSVVDSIRFSAGALNDMNRMLSGKP